MDELRFGNLRTLVYFQYKERFLTSLPKSTKLLLQSRSSASLTADYLLQTFTPYLDALSKLQNIYAEIAKQEPQPIFMESMVYEKLLPEALVQFTISILSEISPKLSAADKIVFAARMLPIISALIQSDLTYVFPE